MQACECVSCNGVVWCCYETSDAARAWLFCRACQDNQCHGVRPHCAQLPCPSAPQRPARQRPQHTNKTMSRNAGHDGIHTHVLAFGKHFDSLAASLPPLAPSSHLCGITNRPGYHRRGAHTAAQGHNISLKLRRLRPQGIQCACRMDALHASISRLPHLPGSGPGHAITGRTPTARCANIPGRHTHTHTPRSYLGTVLLRS
jgi:hypothetical protein